MHLFDLVYPVCVRILNSGLAHPVCTYFRVVNATYYFFLTFLIIIILLLHIGTFEQTYTLKLYMICVLVGNPVWPALVRHISPSPGLLTCA